jgi:serine/threonine protein kinase
MIVGQTIGPYSIIAKIGDGGMGEVYRARDTKLDRDVAIKVLPDLFARDSDRLARFEREAKAVATLSHPNILSIFDLGTDHGTAYAVTELLEGETLRGRLEAGALPQRKAVEYAGQIAAGLAAAHDKGIAHRDIKPENLFVTTDGRIKILDFGLAAQIESPNGGLTYAPTGIAQTDPGTVLGTVGYMAPEQARGQKADHRSDIFSLGCVLHEMLTGSRAFLRETTAETLTAILREDPSPLSQVTPPLPMALERVVLHCLEKRPEDRFQSARDLAFHLSSVSSPSSVDAPQVSGVVKPRRMWLVGVIGAAALVAIAGAAIVFFSSRRASSPRTVNAVAMILPPHGVTVGYPGKWGLELSPDGSRLAFVGRDANGTNAIWVRPIDAPDASRLAGTEDASAPFWSPDGTALGFFASEELRVVDASGGTPRVLCRQVPGEGGGSWGTAGVIVFASNGVLNRVPAAGGDCVRGLKQQPTGSVLSRPGFLPDGRHFIASDAPRLETVIADLETGSYERLRQGAGNASFVAPHWLFFLDRLEGPVFAQRLDVSALRLTGDPVRIFDPPETPIGRAMYTAANNVFVAQRYTGLGAQRLVWFDRRGQEQEAVPTPFDIWTAALSRDGRRLALGGFGIAVHEVDRGVATRIPAEKAPGLHQVTMNPAWSHDGTLLAYSTDAEGGNAIRLFTFSTGTSEELFRAEPKTVNWPDWLPDGRSIVFVLRGEGASRSEVIALSLLDRKTQPLFAAPREISFLHVSPDGKHIVYVSDETGTPEIYVRSLPGPGGAVRVSAAGGTSPVWRSDGKALFYVAPNAETMEVDVRLGEGLVLSSPRVAVRAIPGYEQLWGMSPNGDRFLRFASDAFGGFTLMLGWPSRLEREGAEQ